MFADAKTSAWSPSFSCVTSASDAPKLYVIERLGVSDSNACAIASNASVSGAAANTVRSPPSTGNSATGVDSGSGRASDTSLRVTEDGHSQRAGWAATGGAANGTHAKAK